MWNATKTGILMVLMTALLLFVGSRFGPHGLIIAGAFALIGNVGSYWFSDKIVLRIYRAKEVSESEAPDLHATVERLAHAAGLPTPKVCIVPSQSPNAFATGRNPSHAVVAVTEGSLRLLSSDELEGVLAHEMAHVANRDMLISTIVAVMAGTIMMLATIIRWGLLFRGMGGRGGRDGGPLVFLAIAILAPIAAVLIQLAVSRSREYEADAQGARLAGDPRGLAGALEKLQMASQRVPLESGPATAHMFIVNPLSGKGLARLFSSHPPTEERIRRLRNMTII